MVRSRKIIIVAIGLLLLFSAGCGEDTTVTVIIGPIPPKIVDVSPDNGAVNVNPAVTVTAKFSQDMVPSTINDSTFTLRSPAGDVPAAVSYIPNSRTARLQPLAPLALLTTYTATVSFLVRSEDGFNLPANFIWSFTTEDNGAGTSAIPTAPGSLDNPILPPDPGEMQGFSSKVAVLGEGDALAVWEEPGTTGASQVVASRFDGGKGIWGPPEQLGTKGEAGWNPRLAVDADGNFIVVWEQEEGLASRVFPPMEGQPD
jgi:hypothetical protein